LEGTQEADVMEQRALQRG